MALDAALAQVDRYGFNLVQRPEVRLLPLDVLGRDDVLEPIGPLAVLFDSTAAAPQTPSAVPSATFSGQLTELMHVTIAERILVRLLNGLGSDVRAVQLDPRGDAIRFARFSFDQITQLSTPVQDIAAYLQAGQPRPGPIRDRYMLNPEADAYVITSVLQAHEIRLLPLDIGSKPVAMDTPVLAARLEHAVTVDAVGEWIRFSGKEAATLAFSCYRLAFAGGTWGLDGASGQPLLIAPGTRVMVRRGAPPPVAA